MAGPKMVSPQFPVAGFAPPLTDELLAKYKSLAATAEGEVKDAMLQCLACVEAWWDLPESTRTDGPSLAIRHRGKDTSFRVTPLEAEHVKTLDAATPWMRELDTLSTPRDDGLFDGLPNGELRNAAFHLLWYAKELTLDREPLTLDRLPN